MSGPILTRPPNGGNSIPRIWVSRNKHANYRTLSACNNGGVLLGLFETCNSSPGDAGRFLIWSDHNIGSAHHHLRDCVYSTNTGGEVECFWSGTYFGGCQLDPSSTAPPYSPFLNSIVYGCYMYGSGVAWCSRWGV